MWLTGDTAKWVNGLLNGTPGEQQVIDNASPIHIAFTTVPSDIGSVNGLTLVQMSPGSVGYSHDGQNIPLVIYQGVSPASRKKEYAGDQEIDIDDGSLDGLTVVPVNL
ncbi:hypothetical protein H0H93_011812 [Arthromyces matolae]|nr:hypothetical protein H0H93_011812 [Arthromyces matolae]